MNDEAREVLVAAALRGHRQVKEMFHDVDADEGECALGVLHLTCHKTRLAAMRCGVVNRYTEIKSRYELSEGDTKAIWIANDEKGLGFLDIARKVGTEEAL